MTELEKIKVYVMRNPNDPVAYHDAVSIFKQEIDEGKTEYHAVNREFRKEIGRELRSGRLNSRDMERLNQVYRQSLLVDARVDFDAYCLYIEADREPGRQFYLPRRRVLGKVAEDLQRLIDRGDGHPRELDLLTISLPPGVGKLLADDTPVMTKGGWKSHGDLAVGDYVVGLDGKYKRVQHVFEKDVANYEIEFTNKEVVRCHENHEWIVFDKHRQKYRLCTVKDMLKGGLESGIPGKRGHRYYYLLPNAEPMEGKETDLPMDPYLFGAWIGDGTSEKPAVTICNTDTVILAEFMRKYKLTHIYDQAGCKRYEFDWMRTDLQKMGMCYAHRKVEKYIPDVYMTAPVHERLELLAGLIDTDGTASGDGKYTFSTANKSVKDSVFQLISTFGWRCCVREQEPCLSTSGVHGKKKIYIIIFCPDAEIPCRVRRKRNRKVAVRRRVAVKAIRKIEPVSGNCIQVEDGIYRVGKTMIPTHNSTLAIFFITWIGGLHPDKAILTFSHDSGIVRGFYDEVLRIIGKGGEYLYRDVFPETESPLVGTNAKELRIDLGTNKRFETFQFSSVGAGNAGKYRASGLLYCDDLCSGIEEALSKERMDKLWRTYTTDLRQRTSGDPPELHIATRWSVWDVIGRLQQQYQDHPSGRAKFLAIPALNEKEESNFDYPMTSDRFTTDRYWNLRDAMDDTDWRALYMNEPIEREGQLYHPDELRRFFELPDMQPDGVVSICDTKAKGSDYCFMPIAYVYGNDWYIADCICDNGDPGIIEERLVKILMAHNVRESQFESNSAGWKVADNVQTKIHNLGGTTRIITKPTTANKDTKIVLNAPAVKEHCLFLDPSRYKANSDYGRMMSMLTGYTLMTRNKHDDVPDGMAMLVLYMDGKVMRKAQVIERPF